MAEFVNQLSAQTKTLNREYQNARKEYDNALVKVGTAKEAKKMDVVKFYKVCRVATATDG